MSTSLPKKIILLCLSISFVAQPLVSYAQTTDITTGAPRAIIVDEDKTYQSASLQGSQADIANSGTTGQTFGLNAQGAAGSFAVCAGAGALGNFVKEKIQEFVGGVLSPTRVPTSNIPLEGKEVGVLGFSWDQLGWCMINSLIESIGAATVQWINGGFQGKPVFVDDPEQFFADIADMQAGAFLNELSSGFLCSPIKNIVRVNLAHSYNSSVSPYGQQSCSFTAISGNLEQFMAGDTFSWADWNSYTQNPQNNPYGATLGGQIELDRRIAQSLGIQSTLLDWSAGILSFKDPETGKITSIGSVVQTQLNERLGSGQRRLEIADEFDEVVNALVNQLIKVAINEMTQPN